LQRDRDDERSTGVFTMFGKLVKRGLPTMAGICAMMAASLADAKELRILAWQGYADDDWVKEFEQKTGANVSVVFIGTDDEVWAKIKGSEGEDFDLFAINTAQLQRYIDAGLTTPIDLDKVPNQKRQLPIFADLTKVKGVMRDGEVHAIPFCFDSIGLIYDTDKVSPPPTSMDVLWDPKYKGKILAYDNGEHNFSFTALTMGIADPFNLSAAQLDAAKAKLIALKNNVLSFYSTADESLQIYQSNDVALIWANYGQQQVKSMLDAGAHIAFVSPSEGALVWLDTWALTSGVEEKELAEQWIDFVLRKQIGEQLSQRTGFGNTVTPLPNAGANNRLIYLEAVEDATRRSVLWKEIKAAQ
jgi:putative spermidine/putrescine transport system substrate-binding protein